MIKRDRQSLFHKELKVPHELRRPRFSFSLCNCQKTDGQTVRTPKAETHAPANQHPPIKETLERRSSSPAAPPPSFSDRAYRPHTAETSTANFKKQPRSDNHLKINTKYRRKLSTGRNAQLHPTKNARFPGFLPQQDRNRRPMKPNQHFQNR